MALDTGAVKAKGTQKKERPPATVVGATTYSQQKIRPSFLHLRSSEPLRRRTPDNQLRL
jgi:hypothetical protein